MHRCSPMVFANPQVAEEDHMHFHPQDGASMCHMFATLIFGLEYTTEVRDWSKELRFYVLFVRGLVTGHAINLGIQLFADNVSR